MSVTGQVVGGLVGRFPPGVIRAMARQYAAGATVDDARREIRSLRGRGTAATASLLGEAATTEDYADRHVRELGSVLTALRDPGNAELDVRLGVKPTALGVDVSRDLAARNLRAIARGAAEAGCAVEVDMEKLGYVDPTLDLVRTARAEPGSTVCAVVQAYLHRTSGDVDALLADRTPTRIVKGTYKETADHAYQLYESVRENFVALVRRYLEAGVWVGVGTHDEYVIVRVLELVRELGAPPDAYEFQMIMGVQEGLRRGLVEAGHPVRVTVHFGSDLHLWSVRRLRENPEIAKYALLGIADAVRSRSSASR